MSLIDLVILVFSGLNLCFFGVLWVGDFEVFWLLWAVISLILCKFGSFVTLGVDFGYSGFSGLSLFRCEC